MNDLEAIRRKKLFDGGATFVAQWATIIGFFVVVPLGYAFAFDWIWVSPTKALFLGSGVAWLAMMLVYLVATLMSSSFFKDRND